MKLTAIIATATAPLETLVWAVSSLLLRTPADLIHEVIVSINGPDPRTGDVTLQDQKQKFLEGLAEAGYPVRVVRTWSRLGFSQPFEMCLPMCTTDHVLFMHDDVIVTDKDWWKQIDEDVAFTSIKPVLNGKLLPNAWQYDQQLMRIDFPSVNTIFSVINRAKLPAHWTNYYINLETPQDERDWGTMKEFFLHHPEAVNIMPDDNIANNIATKSRLQLFKDFHRYSLVTYPVGAWAWHYLTVNEVKTNVFTNVVDHLEAMSWKEGSYGEVAEPMPSALNLIEEVKNSSLKDACPISNHNTVNISGLRPLVAVITYKRTISEARTVAMCTPINKVVKKWLRAWNNADHYGGKLLVIQNYDKEVPPDDKELIIQSNPDFYITRKNVGQDMGAFADLVTGKLKVDYDWNVLLWFTDDTIPMRKDFMLPFLRELTKPHVGLVGGWRMETNVRTIAFGIKREIAEKLKFPELKLCQTIGENKDAGAIFVTTMECGKDNLSAQVRDMGLQFVEPTQRYSPKYAWDCDYEGIVDLWDKYEAQF